MALEANGQGGDELPAVEQKFAAANDSLYAKVLDLNVAQSQVQSDITSIMTLRGKLLGLYGVAPDPKWRPGATGTVVSTGGSGAPLMNNGEVSWKTKLSEGITKKGISMEKGQVTYETVCVDPAAKPQYWNSTVNCPHLAQSYTSEAPELSKKLAEHAAAKAAVKAEFPDLFAEGLLMSSGVPVERERGQKRKVPGESAGPEGKAALQHTAFLLLQRSINKEDIVYQVAESGGSYTATVSMPLWNPSKTWTGTAAITQKDAEKSAAEKAVAELAEQVAPLQAEHEAKKRAKIMEKRAAADAKKPKPQA